MSSSTKQVLPPNPYSRQPIKNREQLAGRAREMRAIKYYLGLTAAGQSPHLALIGQRGVGKTSLLNATEVLANELKLLPIRLDMNEQKVKSPGEFWHDLYATLILRIAQKGCWGGLQGPIYADLFRMMHGRQQPSTLSNVVLQTPFALSCHQGDLSTFVCTDALVAHDFMLCIEELKNKNHVGIALLIDEADCLGQNVPLLQMFRNIFQVVERCSLILAGTEAVFPTISEVFSPVPRQFHRIDIKPFVGWPDTAQLVMKALPRENKDIAPSIEIMEDLHNLCGGDPSEVQLYCHHMYRMVEDGSSARMGLMPKVFREVLREYRNNASANVDSVLNAIERLPDQYLFESRWLSRRNLTLDENVRVEILRRELRDGARLSPEERQEVNPRLQAGYGALFNAGIIESGSSLRLVGEPLTAGFWKSFVEVEKGKRWQWNSDTFAENLRAPVMTAIAKTHGVEGHFLLDCGDGAIHALELLRKGEKLPDYRDSFAELLITGMMAKQSEKDAVACVDVGFQMESPAGRHTFCWRFLEDRQKPITRDSVVSWVTDHSSLLAENEINVTVSSFSRFELPTSDEFHRLARIAGYQLPEKLFGPPELDSAISKFSDGKIEECASMLARMLSDKEEEVIANNLGFCQILLGKVEDGLRNVEIAIAMKFDPLYELNKGVALFLQSSQDSAKDSLKHALEWIRDEKNKYDVNQAFCILLLDKSGRRVSSVSDVPIDVAILINLWFAGGLSKEELLHEMAKAYPNESQTWHLLVEQRV